ncbi:hypothetical protein GOBAR_AA09862 [Gossypium barbadense]|uniref:Uncharacterized protein n=1 Tax=Gossypium barbadense TaxID=3634 RepID=A0A2P5Y5B9_GOSBA|nr:hypothetical protein GOBAR_AA09862 [Gossypium barbadense]
MLSNISTKSASSRSTPKPALAAAAPFPSARPLKHLKKRLAAVFEQQRAERICKEIEEQEFEEAQAFLQETEKHLKRGKMKPILDGEKLTKQTLLEQAMSEQLKERQEQEKRLQKLEVELSRQHHDGDLKKKNRLARMLENYSGLEAGKGYQEEENILCEAAEQDYEKEKLNKRIAKFSGGVAVIQVGAQTDFMILHVEFYDFWDMKDAILEVKNNFYITLNNRRESYALAFSNVLASKRKLQGNKQFKIWRKWREEEKNLNNCYWQKGQGT